MGDMYLSVHLGCTQTCHSDILILELLKKLLVNWKVPSQSLERALCYYASSSWHDTKKKFPGFGQF